MLRLTDMELVGSDTILIAFEKMMADRQITTATISQRKKGLVPAV